MKLISMTSFVLKQHEKFKSDRFYHQQFKDNIVSYAKFLNQPLTLGMFIPVDKHGNITEPLKGCCSGADCGCMGMPINVSSREEMDEVLEAESRVLFKDSVVIDTEPHNQTKRILIMLKNNPLFRIYNQFDYHDGRVEKQTFPNYENLIIEDIIKYDLELTPSALKQIGLNP